MKLGVYANVSLLLTCPRWIRDVREPPQAIGSYLVRWQAAYGSLEYLLYLHKYARIFG